MVDDAKASTAPRQKNSYQMNLFLSLIAKTNNIPVQVAFTTLPQMLPTEELVESIKDDEESTENANHALANISESSSRDIDVICND